MALSKRLATPGQLRHWYHRADHDHALDGRGLEDFANCKPGVGVPPSDLRRDDYVERALRGGYPEAVRRSDPSRRGRLFESYISDVINRNVRQLTEIQRTGDMRRLVNLIAASTSTLANPSNMANRLQV